MFGSTAVSVRLKKECADFISEFFANKQEFMRKAIETYCEAAMVRLLHPQGGASFNFYEGGFGMVQYHWNYYKGRQFIVITNEAGYDFQRNPSCFKDEIYKLLKIQENEEVDFYVPSDVVRLTSEDGKYSKLMWKKDKFAYWDFENKCFGRGGNVPLTSISGMIELMNMHNSHYLLNRKAFIYEKIYDGVTLEWEDEPSIHCKSITGPL
jgi:hypothetical protein